MHSQLRSRILLFIAAALISTSSMASGLASYSQNFDNLDINGAEIGAGWLYFNNVFETGVVQFGYSGSAPNGPQISALVDDQREPGTQQLSVYSDYECCSPDQGHQSAAGLVQTNVFQEQTILACNIGQTWTFSFDARLGNLGGASTAKAFLKVIDPESGFSETIEVSENMTATSTDWTSYELELTVGDWEAQLLQFGFQSEASNFEPSGVFYDDVSFDGEGSGICPFSDDFESYNDTVETVLGDAGYLVFGNVFTPAGDPLFGYGPFPAPNQSGAFSGVSVGEGGPGQGSQQLNTFSDYNNVDQHTAGNLIESIVYREQSVGASNVGQTWRFTFDAKLGNLVAPTTAKAFLKTLDPNSGFVTTAEVEQDTTSTPTTWQGYTLDLTIDASMVGNVIQIGFSNLATNFESSGVFYDNITFDIAPGVDTDGDGIDDSVDNCTDVMNAGQQDTDGDLIGNACDTDYNNDCNVSFIDIGQFGSEFGGTNALFDHNADGAVNFLDYFVVTGFFLSPPGPSAAGCN